MTFIPNNKKLFVLMSAVLTLLFFCASGSVSAAREVKGDGSFTVASLNVDGLPKSILGIEINPDGLGAEGSERIGGRLSTTDWDIIGVSEDFNYHDSLYSGSFKKEYESATHRGGVGLAFSLPIKTDGLCLFYKKSVMVDGEKWVKWNEHYPSSGFGNGGDHLIEKGFRYYEATIDGVKVDVYIFHMDADSDKEDIAARESQLRQLVEHVKKSDNGNPIILMGDTNCRYTREHLEKIVIDGISEDERFTVSDAWVEDAWDGKYPKYGGSPLMAKDKTGNGSGYDYPKAEIVDKIIYINNSDSDVWLTLEAYTVHTEFTDSNGSPLADHWPITAEFTYSKRHTVTYEDGVGGRVFGKIVIDDAFTGLETPEFPGGTPTRDGYIFDGWEPAVSATVNKDATYTARWHAVPKETEPPETESSETKPPETESSETKPSETKPTETKPNETEATEIDVPVTGAPETGAQPVTTDTDAQGTEVPGTMPDSVTTHEMSAPEDDGGGAPAPILISIGVCAAAAVAAVSVVVIKKRRSKA